MTAMQSGSLLLVEQVSADGLGDVTLTSTGGGSITGVGVVSGNGLTLTADTGINVGTAVDLLAASTTTSGDIVIDESNALILGMGGNGISTAVGSNGDIVVVAGGTLTLAELVSADGTGDVTLTSTGGSIVEFAADDLVDVVGTLVTLTADIISGAVLLAEIDAA